MPEKVSFVNEGVLTLWFDLCIIRRQALHSKFYQSKCQDILSPRHPVESTRSMVQVTQIYNFEVVFKSLLSSFKPLTKRFV